MPLFPAPDDRPDPGANAAANTSSTPQDPNGSDSPAEPQAWLATIVGSSDDAIIGKTLDGIIMRWNAGAERLFGYTVAEAVGRSVTMLIPPDRQDEEPAILERLRRGEPVEQYETVRLRKGGAPVEVSLTISPVRDATGRIIGATKIAREISERRRLEELTRRLAAVVESSNDAVLSTDLRGVIQSWNSGAERLFGYTVGEAVGRAVTMLIPIGRRDEEPEMLRRVQQGERIEHYETVRRRKDGTVVDVSLTMAPILNASGHVLGATKIVRDIGERKRGAEADRRLAAIVESSDDAIISKNLDGVIESWNAGAERVFGYTAAEAIGRPVLMLIPEGRQDEEPVILDRLRRRERIEHYETVRRRKDGILIDVSLTVSPIIDGSGKVVGASKIARDVTAQKRVQRELTEAHANALAANRAKDDFLAALSHELRTPLNPVLLLASESADDPTLPPAVRNDFDLIRKNIELEARLIDDLLDLARITRGKLPLSTSPNDLHAIVRDAIETIRADADTKKLMVDCNFSAAPLTVTGDAVRLQQVLWNVLKNAVKFTPEGGRIGISTRGNPVRGCAVVEISDTGVGLAKDELERIFDAFVQGGTAVGQAHRFGGLGLGLTISKLITELHRGSIRAVSEGRGRGATFIIELPIVELPEGAVKEKSRAPGASAGRNEGGPKPRILLVEDHEPSRKTLAHLLKRRGFDVSPVGTAADARTVAANETLDLALCDIGLPDGDGVELIAELNRRHGLKSIALTGFGMEPDIERSRQAGASAHLTKPVSIQALENALAAWFEARK